MVYFRCTSSGSGKGNTVIVTCAEQFAGVAVTIAKIGKSYTKVCPLTAPYVIKFYGLEAGTYTVSATVSGQTYSTEVIVQDVSCVLNYGFTWKLWVDTASQLDSSDYASLSEVLADEEAVRELFTEHACVDYMASVGASNADLETIIENDLCAKWINNSDYALDFLEANTIIKSLMDTADKYGYGEWVITDDSTTPPTWGAKGNVPVMTANNAPYGEAFASSTFDGNNPAWAAFDDDDSHQWTSAGGVTNGTLGYKFTTPVCVKMVKIQNSSNQYCDNSPHNFTIEASNDNSTWDVLFTGVYTKVGKMEHENYKIDSDNYYLYYRINATDKNGSSLQSVAIGSLQFYGRELKVSVPTMTSNTAPFGEAFASSENTGAYNAFTDASGSLWTTDTSGRAGSYIGYEFLNPTIILQAIVTNRSDTATTQSIKECKLQYYDGNDWQDASNIVTLPQGGSGVVNANSTHNIKRWRLLGISNYGDSRMALSRLQFYGKDYSEKEFEVGTTKKWLYDHGVELETLTNFGSATITRESSQMFYAKTSGIGGIKTVNTIDLTNFNLVRMKIGNKLTITNGEIAVDSTNYIAYKIIPTSDMPNNANLSITSVTGNYDILTIPNTEATGNFSFAEWWLE